MSGSEEIRAPRGTVDLVGEVLWRHRAVEAAAHAVFSRFGYSEIRTPVFEETRLFARAVGETSDIVEKEMFSIPREAGSYSLRPEGTASVVRHYVENSLASNAPFQKLYYVGPMFRYERPQAGRQREFHQVGIEAFGSPDPRLDVEMILVMDRFFRALGVEGHEVKVNTIGCRECRPAWREDLIRELAPHRDALCANCVRRLEKNPLRVLDCKEEGCGEIVKGLKPVDERVCGECREHYEAVLGGLSDAGVAFTKAPLLVRGLDYYTRTVFETVHPELGARSSICGGGRYDGLVEDLGGPPIPALGFAVGVEATLLALDALGRTPPGTETRLDAYVVAVKDECRPDAFELLGEIRDAGVAADMDYEGRGMKAQLKKADRAGARISLILGPGEVERGVVTLRRMEDGEQSEAARAEAVAAVRMALGQSR